MGNRDDWTAPDGGFDYEEFQEDTSWASDLIGMQQRREQLNEMQEIKSLLKKQQAEKDRVQQLPQCPSCKSRIERGAKKCPSCRDEIVWFQYGVLPEEPYELISFPETLSQIIHKEIYDNNQLQKLIVSELKDSISTIERKVSSIQNLALHKFSSLDEGKKAFKKYTSLMSKAKKLSEELLSNKKKGESIQKVVGGFGCLVSIISIALVFYHLNLGDWITEFQGPMWAIFLRSFLFISFIIVVLIITAYLPSIPFVLYTKIRSSLIRKDHNFTQTQQAIEKLCAKNVDQLYDSVLQGSDIVMKLNGRIHDYSREVHEIKLLFVSLKKEAVKHGVKLPTKITFSNVLQPDVPPLNFGELAFSPTYLNKLKEYALATNIPWVPAIENREHTNNYWLKRGDTIKGPLTSDKLQELLKSKKAKSNDEIGTSENGPWSPLKDIHKSILKM